MSFDQRLEDLEQELLPNEVLVVVTSLGAPEDEVIGYQVEGRFHARAKGESLQACRDRIIGELGFTAGLLWFTEIECVKPAIPPQPVINGQKPPS